MIFGLERFWPRCFSSSYSDDEKKGRQRTFDLKPSPRKRMRASSVCRNHLERKAGRRARRLWKDELVVGRRGRRIQPHRDDTSKIPPQTFKTPFRLLKNIWDTKRDSKAIAENQGSRRYRTNPGRGRPRTRTKRTCTRRRLRKTAPRRKQNIRPRRKSNVSVYKLKHQQHEKPKYAEEKPDVKIIKIQRRRRYKSDDGENEKRLTRPVRSTHRDRVELLKESTMSIQKSAGTSEKEVGEDPLNVSKLHRSYVKRIQGRPADVARSDSMDKNMSNSRGRNRRRVKKRTGKTSLKQLRRRRRSKSRSRLGRREVDYLIQSRRRDKMDSKRKKCRGENN